MTARDALAFELFVGDNANQPRESSIQDWVWFKVSGKFRGQVEHYKAMAEHALAVGYRKPCTITTAQELDALPVGSAIIHDEGWGHTIAERHVSDGLWYVTGCLEYIRPEALIPATVLHEGTQP